MKRLIILPVLLAMLVSVSAEDWNIGGKVYKNVVVVDRDDDGVRVTYEGGLGEIQYADLPLDIQKRFGEDYETLQAKKRIADVKMAQREAELAQRRGLHDGNPATADPLRVHPPSAIATAQPVGAPHPTGSPTVVAVAAPPRIAVPAPPPPPDPYPGASYSYDPTSDYCCLDSLPIALTFKSGAGMPGGLASVVLRSVTEGRKPEIPVRMEAIFYAPGLNPKVLETHAVSLIRNGNSTMLHSTVKTEGDSISPGNYSYDLTPDQARSIVSGQKVEFGVGKTVYAIKPVGLVQAKKYLSRVVTLPPASSELVRMYNHFLERLPSLVNMISMTCLCILLSGAALATILFFCGTTLGAIKLFNP